MTSVVGVRQKCHGELVGSCQYRHRDRDCDFPVGWKVYAFDDYYKGPSGHLFSHPFPIFTKQTTTTSNKASQQQNISTV